MAEEGKLYEQYLKADEEAENHTPMITIRDETEIAYQILRLIRTKNFSVKEALDILEDAKALVLETTSV